MIRALMAFLFLAISSPLSADILSEIENGKLFYGEKVTAKDLKGKVILFEYWGLN